jgi:hypothetical protein
MTVESNGRRVSFESGKESGRARITIATAADCRANQNPYHQAWTRTRGGAMSAGNPPRSEWQAGDSAGGA